MNRPPQTHFVIGIVKTNMIGVACGLRHPTLTWSTDSEETTCKRCLRVMHAKEVKDGDDPRSPVPAD